MHIAKCAQPAGMIKSMSEKPIDMRRTGDGNVNESAEDYIKVIYILMKKR